MIDENLADNVEIMEDCGEQPAPAAVEITAVDPTQLPQKCYRSTRGIKNVERRWTEQTKDGKIQERYF